MADSTPSLRMLVDTNVILDMLLAREPWDAQEKPIWDARDAGQLSAYLPASVITDIFYIARKQVGPERARAAVGECLRRCIIIPVDGILLETALNMIGPDFEDNVQIACAQSLGLDAILTRNAADYRASPIPAVEPGTLVDQLAQP